jgi:hypothetical protein
MQGLHLCCHQLLLGLQRASLRLQQLPLHYDSDQHRHQHCCAHQQSCPPAKVAVHLLQPAAQALGLLVASIVSSIGVSGDIRAEVSRRVCCLCWGCLGSDLMLLLLAFVSKQLLCC